MTQLSADRLRHLARRLHLPLRQHHITVLASGYLYIRASTVKRTNLSTAYHLQSATWHHGKIYQLTFGIEEGRAKVERVNARTDALRFHCSQIAHHLVPANKSYIRVRIAHISRKAPDGTIRIQLRTQPTRDIYHIWQNIGPSTHT